MGQSKSTQKGMAPKELLQHNHVYTFKSVKDKNVIELPDSSTSSGMPIVVKKEKSGPSQKFKAVQIDPGEFQISSLVQAAGDEVTKVWDFMPGDALLIQNTASTGANQSWVAEEIYPNSKICFIRSKNDKRCLRNMGVGKQVALVAEDRRDAYQHWKLETTI